MECSTVAQSLISILPVLGQHIRDFAASFRVRRMSLPTYRARRPGTEIRGRGETTAQWQCPLARAQESGRVHNCKAVTMDSSRTMLPFTAILSVFAVVVLSTPQQHTDHDLQTHQDVKPTTIMIISPIQFYALHEQYTRGPGQSYLPTQSHFSPAPTKASSTMALLSFATSTTTPISSWNNDATGSTPP